MSKPQTEAGLALLAAAAERRITVEPLAVVAIEIEARRASIERIRQAMVGDDYPLDPMLKRHLIAILDDEEDR